MKLRFRPIAGVISVAALVAGSVLLGGAANAYTTTGCHWSTTGPSYANLGGTGMASEVTTSVAAWITSSDVTSMSNNGNPSFKIGPYNRGANGYQGWTDWTCSGSTTTYAYATANPYYTNGFTVGMRQAVWVHEIGHALGLNHSSATAAVMYSCATCAYANFGTKTPQLDDYTGMNTLY